MMHSLFDSLNDCVSICLVACLLVLVFGWLVDGLIGLIHWLIGLLVCWLTGVFV